MEGEGGKGGEEERGLGRRGNGGGEGRVGKGTRPSLGGN